MVVFASLVFVGKFLVASLLGCSIYYYLSNFRLFRASWKIPGPFPWPCIGSAHRFIGNTEDILNTARQLLKPYPSPFRVWFGSRLFYVVYDPEQLKIVLSSQKTIEKEVLYELFQPWLGTGLFTAPASKWRVHRKLIMPTFNQRILESFVEVFSAQSGIMVKEMEAELNGGEFEVFNYVTLCTLDIICETAMGVSSKAQLQKSSPYVKSANRLFEIIYSRIFNIWLHPDFIFKRTRLWQEQRNCIKHVHGLTNDVIRKKKNSLFVGNGKANGTSQEDNETTPPTVTRKAFLDLLMELSHEGTKFTDDELREEVDTMMIAGNDTTATVNCFAMLMLAMYPEIQDKVYEELHGIYGYADPSSVPVRHEDLQRMEYLERVIKETMRIFPIGPLLVRRITDDLNIGEHTLAKGSSVVLGIIKTHRSSEYWRDPMKFDPDRFLPEECAKRHPYCFIPFSAGPRNCLGVKYAMMAVKALLATVVRKYVLKKDDVLAIEDIKLKADMMLKPVVPITIRIEKRIECAS
ncbi:cytochrome P450 4C1-like [Copidosoma floridanum]|uniref:cytochrome P450 4C1-like n=1 Tax=Copidosoma floridanum TaxID=29053 RepID=UPI0006C970BD|nr:cytochrome P450 4C1-like [Copidosoma floridanum]